MEGAEMPPIKRSRGRAFRCVGGQTKRGSRCRSTCPAWRSTKSSTPAYKPDSSRRRRFVPEGFRNAADAPLRRNGVLALRHFRNPGCLAALATQQVDESTGHRVEYLSDQFELLAAFGTGYSNLCRQGF